MSTTRDFVRSVLSDAALPLLRQALEDAVMEVLNDRRVPTRTDYEELRDAVNGMRSQVSSMSGSLQRVEKRLEQLEQRSSGDQPIP